MTIEEMRAAIDEQEAAMMPPGFKKMKMSLDIPAYFCGGGWQIAPASGGWQAACIGPGSSFHINARGPTPVDALDACKAEMRRVAALMMERAGGEAAP